jgi:uncharacterized membrane protein YcaP (DUF421 family)
MIFIDINWKDVLLGEHEWSFAVEIILRTVVMYIVILAGLRLTGKRGVRQLSIFELVVIIGLGSSAGDPMFYKDVGLIAAIVVFIVVISMYRLTTYLTGKSDKFERLIEGTTVCLINEGRFSFKDFDKEDLAQDEFFSELRAKGVSQIGQVERGYLEISGEVSLFFYPDKDVRPGLPILPHEFEKKSQTIAEPGLYACTFCGHTEELEPVVHHKCPVCERDTWTPASTRKRIT